MLSQSQVFNHKVGSAPTHRPQRTGAESDEKDESAEHWWRSLTFFAPELKRREKGVSSLFQGSTSFDEGQLSFLRALSDAQRREAILYPDKTINNILAAANSDNATVDYAGLRVSTLTDSQKQQLLRLTSLYVGNLREGHARVRMDEVEQHLDETTFAWIGGTSDDAVFYYRIHSPVVLIEFDHQRPVGTAHLRPKNVPTRQHIHVVVRTPNGNDYGKDLLRQHLEAHPH